MKTLEKIFQRPFIAYVYVCVFAWTRSEYRPFYKRRYLRSATRKPFVFTIECGSCACATKTSSNVWPQLSSNGGEIKRRANSEEVEENKRLRWEFLKGLSRNFVERDRFSRENSRVLDQGLRLGFRMWWIRLLWMIFEFFLIMNNNLLIFEATFIRICVYLLSQVRNFQ